MIRRLVGQLHLWLALVTCAPLIVLGLTGSILVFEDQWRDIGVAGSPQRDGAAPPHAVSEILAAAQKAGPQGFVAVSYAAPDEPGRPAMVRLAPARRGVAAELIRVDVDPISLAAVAPPQPDLLRQIFFLHSTLLLKNRDGRQLVGWLGVVMLIMGITGLVNWWPARRGWRAAFIVSRQARGRRLQRELHGAVGIWGLVVFITVSFGGVYLAFPESIHAAVSTILPARDLRAAATAMRVTPEPGATAISVDDAIGLAQAELPGAQPRLVFLPRQPDQPFRIALLRPGQDRRAVPVSVLVDPWRKQVVATLDPADFSPGETLLAWQHALHAGQALGWGWKILVFLTGFLPLLFAVSGVLMWRMQRRRRKSAGATPTPLLDDAYTARRAGE
jgi:uncharacterized iron-regulated membrane protein